MKAQDRIYEAYLNGMGQGFGEKVRKRIHWICENTKGKQVLDVGCSQGIVDILLAREAKNVLAIDVLEESINFAIEKLSQEQELVRKNVEFRHASFLEIDLKGKVYDTIIMTEILEHLIAPEAFINKALNHLAENGTLIVTVPFGINDYFDHKKTYYCKGILDLLRDKINIKKIECMGKWIGFICVKEEIDTELDMDSLIAQIEANFYEIERELLTEIENTQNKVKQCEKKVAELQEAEITINKYKMEIEEYKMEIEKYKAKISAYTPEMESCEQGINAYKQIIIKHIGNEKNVLQENVNPELLQELFIEKDKERDLLMNKALQYLNEIDALLEENEIIKEKRSYLLNRTDVLYKNNEQLIEELKTLKAKYKALSSSKLGKVTLGFWKLKKKIKSKLKR